MLVLGVFAHFLKAMGQIRKDGELISPVEYWRKNPYHSLMTVIGAIVGFVALMEMGQLSPVNAFAFGFMANSVADIIGSRSVNKL